MLRATAKTVVPQDNYLLSVEFDNGEKRVFDVKPYIRGNWYGKLSDVAYFKAAFADGYTISWLNGQDICPDELYDLSSPL